MMSTSIPLSSLVSHSGYSVIFPRNPILSISVPMSPIGATTLRLWLEQVLGVGLETSTVDGQNPALPIRRNIYHNSHSLGSLGSCRILSISSIKGFIRAGCKAQRVFGEDCDPETI